MQRKNKTKSKEKKIKNQNCFEKKRNQ